MNSLFKKPFTLTIHIALAIIMAGAIVTHFCGIQGTLTLDSNGSPTSTFDQTSGPGEGKFPFEVILKDVELSYYAGTSTPMDFKSIISISGKDLEVSMNRIGEFDGWRFYQSAVGPDSSTLSVSYDPAGITITYSGYILLGIGLIGFFFQKKTAWRSLFGKLRKLTAVALFLLSLSSAYGGPNVMQRPLASNLGKIHVNWNDRIAPLQTMAYDITRTLYGSDSYHGYTPEQVLSGWIFYYDEWWNDYCLEHPEILSVDVNNITDKNKKLASKLSLIQWLGTGEAFKIYPYISADGTMTWLSLTGRRPSAMSLEQWKFMQTTMPEIKNLIMQGKNIEANLQIDKLIEGQRAYAIDGMLPSESKMHFERVYNKFGRPIFPAIVSFLCALLYWCLPLFRESRRRILWSCLLVLTFVIFLFVLFIMGSIWWLSGHLPLSNGPETMLLMGLIALIGALCFRNHELRGALLLIAGVALSVCAMGSKTPKIASLMPVLGSPLLSIHVMLVMASYVLFMLMSILSAAALLSRSEIRMERLGVINQLILVPAVALLAGGIFVGAVWANQSWGRYWGWDPKETCALIMLLIYSVPLHWASPALKCFRRPKILHVYLLLAVLSVAFTYFGANYLLPGLHSYA